MSSHSEAVDSYSPRRLLLIIVVSTFVVETLIMTLLPLLPSPPDWVHTLLDSVLLVILLFPAIYLFSFRPMVRHQARRAQAEAALQKAHDELEIQVRERTASLEEANRELQFEVAERKRAEAALKQSERFLHSIIENIPDMIFVKDAADLKFVLFNRAGMELLGLSGGDLIGRSDFDVVPRKIAEQYIAKDREVLSRKQLVVIPEEPIETTCCGARVLHTKKIPILDEQGNPRYLLGISEDITERKWVEEQIRQQVETLTALYAGAQQLAESLDSHKLAGEVVRTCVETFGLSLAWVGRAEPDGRVSVLTQHPAAVDYPRQISVRWDDTPQARGPAGRAIRGGAPAVLNDLLDDPSVSLWRADVQQYGFRSMASFPLVSRHRPFGALLLYSEQPDFFTPERVQFFQGYALQAAAALENARLFEEAERRLSHVEALRRIDVAISSSLDLRVVLDVIVDQTTTQLRADAAGILLFDPQSRTLSYAAGRGFRTRTIQESRLRLGEGYAGQAALERRTLVGGTGQPVDDSPLAAHYRALMGVEGFVTHVATPLVAKGQVVGVLEIFHRAVLNADKEWLNYLETLAGQAAISIDSATLLNSLRRSNTELELAYDATLEGWSRALDLRDKETEGHTQRVTAATVDLARAMGMPDSEIVHLRRGAILHDIGKIGIPDAILLKPGPLTEEEWVVMRKHPQYAYEMLAPIAYLHPALDIPYCHHEKWDGSGYPRGLKGEQIPLSARIFAVVDVDDALGSDRPYRPAWPVQRVRQYVREQSGVHFDPAVAEAYLALNVEA